MKKILCYFTAIMLLLAFAVMTACSAANNDVQSPSPSENTTENPTEVPTEGPTEEPTEAPTEEPTEDPTEEPTEDPSAFLNDFTPYEAKTENEQLILDFFNCVNLDERESMWQFYVPLDHEMAKALYKDDNDGLWANQIERLVVTNIKRVDTSLSDVLMNMERYAYEKNYDWDNAPEYLKDMSLVESYIVCLEICAAGHGSDNIESGHDDWLITLVYDDNVWGLDTYFSVYFLKLMPDTEPEYWHDMEEFVPEEQ